METEDLLNNLTDVLTDSSETTTTSTTSPSSLVSPTMVIVGSVILLGVLAFIIYKLK